MAILFDEASGVASVAFDLDVETVGYLVTFLI
jgi:hypothetical protein